MMNMTGKDLLKMILYDIMRKTGYDKFKNNMRHKKISRDYERLIKTLPFIKDVEAKHFKVNRTRKDGTIDIQSGYNKLVANITVIEHLYVAEALNGFDMETWIEQLCIDKKVAGFYRCEININYYEESSI